jgi:acetolactate synthase-1/2/3 large subunit
VIDMNLSDWLCDAIAATGARHAFLLPSASIDTLCIAAERHPELTTVVVGHELAAGFMADGYARVGQTIGLVFVGAAPGAQYVLPAAINARLEGVPVLFVTGATATNRTNHPEFQNTGLIGSRDHEMFQAVMDCSLYCPDADLLADLWTECQSQLGANRAVHLMIPVDVQDRSMPSFNAAAVLPMTEPGLGRDEKAAIDQLRRIWRDAVSPLLVLGPGLATLRDQSMVETLVSICGAPVTMTIGALGLLAHDAPANLGHFGHGGSQAANQAIDGKAHDLILFVGGGPGARDCMDWHALQNRAHLQIVVIDAICMRPWGDLRPDVEVRVRALDQALHYFCDVDVDVDAEHRTPLQGTRRNPETKPTQASPIERYLGKIQDHLPTDAIVFLDSGTHRRAAVRAWRSRGTRDIHARTESAPMGWGIAAAIGASLAKPGGPVVCLTGDGCMRLMGQEISTAARYGAQVIFVVANNAGYASMSERPGNRPYARSLAQLDRIDWVAYGRIWGVDGVRVTDLNMVEHAIALAAAHDGPFVIDIWLSQDTDDRANSGCTHER